MWRKLLNIFGRQGALRNRGFGIVEVMVSIVVLGFLYLALLHLQTSNDEAVLRMRGRDGAVQIAQEIMDSLKAVGSAAISSSPTAATTIQLGEKTREWKRSLGGKVIMKYSPKVIVEKTNDYVAESKSNYETYQNVYAKQVTVSVQWTFKGSTQSINVAGVVR